MNNSELFMQEFDKLPKDEQFRLGVSGLFQMVQDEAGRMPTGEQARRGYGSLLGQRGRQDKEDDTRLHRDTVREMSSSITNQVQKVKITDVLTDVIQPMEDVLRRISFDNRMHKNRLHHENTLYYQGIISAVNDIGKEGSNTIFRSLYLKWQGFMRHPIWNTFLAINDYVLKPLGRLSSAILFGKKEDPLQKKILKNIKIQTEFLKTGKNSPKSIARQLIDDGVFGFAFNQAIGGVSDIFSALFGGDDPKSEQKQTLEAIESLHQTNGVGFNIVRDVEESSKEIDLGIRTLPLQWLKTYAASPYGKASLMLPRVVNGQLRLTNQGIEDTRREILEGTVIERSLIEEQMRQRESHHENSLIEQRKAADELEKHNKRERRRSFIGGLLKLFSGGGFIVAAVSSALGLIPDTIKNGVWEGFKYVGGVLSKAITSRFDMGQIAMAIGGALALVPPFTMVGVALAALGGIYHLLRKAGIGGTKVGSLEVPDNERTRNLSIIRDNIQSAMKEREAELGLDPSDRDFVRKFNADPMLSRLSALDDTVAMARHDPEFKLSSSVISDLEPYTPEEYAKAHFQEEKRQKPEKRFINWTQQQKDDFAIAQQMANHIGIEAQKIRSQRERSNGILDIIADAESRGDYNMMVGGKRGNLTNMTVREVLAMQDQMIARGHESTAVGRYQMIQETLRNSVLQNPEVNMDSMFDETTQDKLARHLMRGRGYDSFMQGDLSANEFADNLAHEWAALPLESGRSAYAGVGSNKALISRDEVIDTLREMRGDGIGTRVSESASQYASGAVSSAGSGVKALLDVFTGGQFGEATSGFLNEALGSIGIDMPEQEEKEVTAVISDASFRQLSSQIGRIEEALANIPGSSIEIADNFTE